MIDFSLSFFAVALPAVLFAGISKGGFGSGAAFAASTILALVLEPGAALGLMLPLLMVMDAAGMRAYWRRWSPVDARRLVLGALPGVGLGALFYAAVSADGVRLLIGAISVGFVLWQWALKAGLKFGARPMGAAGGITAGVVAGFSSFVSHAGGPPAAVYLLTRPLEKTAFQGTTVLVFTVINALKMLPYGFLGIFTLNSLLADVILAPVAVLGTWIGVRLHYMVSKETFFALTYVLLLATGGKLIFDALT
ncbi:sulfite exporter TauE/SafE family protein [Litorivita sp. NS0012-18]|uniref:sulfite exporter TauE/SafE family protein n=1 Tax=Litorivita sp. NS0012-18 TaxID=3127655 RepID=UPI00310611C7